MWKFHLERGGPSVGESKKAHLVHVDELRFRAQAKEAPKSCSTEATRSPAAGRADARRPPRDDGLHPSDIVWILRKERVPFTALEIDAEAERAKQ